MKVLLTGASGGLGEELLKLLDIQKDLEVLALVHKAPLKNQEIEIVQGDLTTPSSLSEAVKGVDVVIHSAAVTRTKNQEDYFKVNVQGTQNLLQACKINGVRRFVYISTRLADAKGLGYPGSKFEAEEKVKESGLPWLILRLGDVYGLGSTSSINKLIRWVSKIKFVPIMGRGEYKLSPVYIADIIPAILDAALNMELEKRAYLIQGPEEVTYLSLVDRISRYLKVRRLKIFIPALVLQLAVPFVQTIKKNLISKDQINRILGITQPLPDPSVEIWDYRPRKLEEGLKSVVNYEKDKG